MLQLEIHILECGQGDTLLVHINQDKWALIDCNLPSGVRRAAFFRLVESLQIRRLDLVCLTHLHEDHYLGMRDVIEYFTSEGRSIGTNPLEIYKLLALDPRKESNSSEFLRLWNALSDAIDAGLDYRYAHEHATEVAFSDDESIRLLPIGPSPSAVRSSTANALTRGKLTNTVREQLNFTSVVLALRARGTNREFDAVLAADIDGPGFRRGIKCYCEINGQSGDVFPLDAVKVAHHGSLDSHIDSNVVQCRKSETSVAAISAGTKSRVLPDREVLKDFLDGGWTVLLTNKRTTPRLPSDSPLTLSGMRKGANSFDVTISWSDAEGLKWGPTDCQVNPEDLQSYDTAAP